MIHIEDFSRCKGIVTHGIPYVHDQWVRLCNLEMRFDARISSRFTHVIPLSLHSNPKCLTPASSLALLVWLFKSREPLWQPVFPISGSLPVNPVKYGISHISSWAGHTADSWVGNGFRAVLECMQRTGACEAAELHFSSPARGVEGRRLSRRFEEQLQGSKVEWSQGLEFYIYKSC